MIYQFYVVLIFKNHMFQSMKAKSAKTNKAKEFTISAAELSRFGMGVMNKALKVVDTAKKGKITIKLERE